MMASRIEAFAELGRLFQSIKEGKLTLVVFSETTVSSPQVLERVRSLLDEEVGGVIQRVFDLTIDTVTSTIKGKAEQKLSLAKSQFYQFTMSPEAWDYKLMPVQSVNPNMSEFNEADDRDWVEAIEFASTTTKTRKTPTCKPGNMLCGKKCQGGSLNCRYKPTPQQSEVVKAIVESHKAEPSSPKVKPTPEKSQVKTVSKSRAVKFPSQDQFDKTTFEKLKVQSGAGDLGLISKTSIDGKDYFVKQTPLKEAKIETLAYEIAKRMGLDGITVPIEKVTVKKKTAVVMPFLEKDEVSNIGNLKAIKKIGDRDALKVIAFDYIIGNTDRHAANISVDGSGSPVLFDHGFAFHEVTQKNLGTPKDKLDIAVNTLVRDKFGYDTSNPRKASNQKVRDLELNNEDVQSILNSKAEILSAAKASGIDSSGLEARIDRIEQLSKSQNRVRLGDIMHEPEPPKKDTSLQDFFGGLTAEQRSLLQARFK
jgi:hypothetical protein